MSEEVDDKTPGLRELNRLRTREKLSWAALKLAREHGLENVRVPDIASLAGVSTRTFNNYFPSRDAAIAAVAGDRIQRISLVLQQRPAEETLQEALTETFLEEYLHGEEPDLAGAMQLRMIMGNPALHGEFVKAIASMEEQLAAAIAKREGWEPGSLFAEILATSVLHAAHVATKSWLRSRGDVAYSALLREAVWTASALAELHPGS